MRYFEILYETSQDDDRPMAEIVLAPDAQQDLEAIEQWLSQPGSGRRAQQTAQRLIAAIDKLGFTAGMHQIDRFNPTNRQLAVGRYVISYRYIISAAGSRFAYIDRVYGPGRDRTQT
jgi:plasmid stabilization system protein ParE